MSDALELSPEACHGPLLDRAPRILAFDAAAYLPEWQSAVRRTFKQMLGWMPARGELNVRVVRERNREIVNGVAAHRPEGEAVPRMATEASAPLWAREIELVFTSEAHADVRAVLMLPVGTGPFPAMICLQGHGPDMQATLGQSENPAAKEAIASGHDFAVQAVRRGYAALAFDMRGFGERADRREPKPGQHGCHHAAMTALLLGRTLVGERVWDVVRAVDVLETLAEIDKTRIGVMGHSGGGTVAFYAAAFDARISAVICSCSVCTYGASIARIDHCADNYLPGILHYVELSDLAGLIVPRPLVIVNGEADPMFPAEGVRECTEEIEAIFAAAGAREKLAVRIVAGGHEVFVEQMWAGLDTAWAGKT